MVLYTATLDTDLVADDYYQQEVNYQATIDAKRNGLAIKKDLIIKQEQGVLSIHFPESFAREGMNGTVHFYHPKNVKYDTEESLKLSENNIQIIDKKKLHKGNYTIKMLWEANGKKYHIEKSCYVS
jgi:hypothetical protein